MVCRWHPLAAHHITRSPPETRMDALIGMIGNFVVVIGLLFIGMYVVKQIVPGPYRLTQRFLKRLGDVALFHQAKRRGWLFAIFVHLLAVCAVALVVLGILTGTYEVLLVALVIGALAFIASRALGTLRRLRARRHSLPSWWR